MIRKVALYLISLVTSFALGYSLSNYHWLDSHVNGIEKIHGASSVDFSLIYLEKYLAGESEEAHRWIVRHALSNPEWNVRTEETWKKSMDAFHYTYLLFSNPSLEGTNAMGADYVGKLKARQSIAKEAMDNLSPPESL